ncbi:MAG: hypothetical protein AB1705_03955 [Verrucomicrobiota bacterium]
MKINILTSQRRDFGGGQHPSSGFGAGLALLLCLVGAKTAPACSDYGGGLTLFARQAVSAEAEVAKAAIATLRKAGPDGLRALQETHAALLTNWRSGQADNSPEWARVRHAMDAVGQQKDCHASGLYWHTDLEQAKVAARASGKPILSLRLLGQLDEELSCANSRFFRTTLYANRDVAGTLNSNFVLHWESVRPVPKVKVDFGDGRELQTTVTGNSIHYVLSEDGAPIDALPGLYSATAFQCGLLVAGNAAKNYARLPAAERPAYLRDYHRSQLALLATRWEADLKSVGAAPVSALAGIRRITNAAPTAALACQLTVLKTGAERPFLQSITIGAYPDAAQLDGMMNPDMWRRLGMLYAQIGRSPADTRLIREKLPNAREAGRLTLAKSAAETPVLDVFENLRRSIGEDTARNEYQLHRRIREWFVAARHAPDLKDLNGRVYADLFLTPDSDPWLGLLAPDAFNAIENGGIKRSAVLR